MLLEYNHISNAGLLFINGTFNLSYVVSKNGLYTS